MIPKLCVLAVCLVLVIHDIDAARGASRRQRKKLQDADSDIDALESTVEALQQRLDAMDGSGACSVGNVHFYFHGDHDGHDHSDHSGHEDDQHVHVHIHSDDDHHAHDADHPVHTHKALCDLHNPDLKIDGFVRFQQMSNESHTHAVFDFYELGDGSGAVEYRAHVHQFGDLSGGCDKVGKHYDPYDDNVDVGDLGVVVSDGGKVSDAPRDTYLSLFGDESIVGRSVMIHGPGDANACCVIGWSHEDFTDDSAHHHMHSVDHDSHMHSHSMDHDHSPDHDHSHHHHNH